MTKPASAGAILSPAASEFPLFRGRLKVPLDIQSFTAMLLAEPQLAVRALVIVLENALQLSSEEDLVEVQVRQNGDTLEFHVLDRGPGVPPDMVELVFEPFTQ